MSWSLIVPQHKDAGTECTALMIISPPLQTCSIQLTSEIFLFALSYILFFFQSHLNVNNTPTVPALNSSDNELLYSHTWVQLDSKQTVVGSRQGYVCLMSGLQFPLYLLYLSVIFRQQLAPCLPL